MSPPSAVKQPRILVTGASGYIGRQVLRSLVAEGLDVHATARTPPREPGRAMWIAADLLDAAERRRLMAAIRPTHLLHLAWTTAHGAYWTSPQNVDWLAATLDLARIFGQAGGQRLVSAGTCMEQMIAPGKGDLGSAAPLASRPLYSVAKYACCMVLDQLAHDFGVKFAWARIFFSFGEHEHPARLVPSVINSLLADTTADCTSGTQLRDFMHVRDVGAALAKLLLSECEGNVDLGTGEGIRIADLVGLLGALMDKPHLIRLGALPSRPGEPCEVVADAGRLRREVGFTPRYSLEQGLREAIAWWDEEQGRTGTGSAHRTPHRENTRRADPEKPMKILIDKGARTVVLTDGKSEKVLPYYSKDAFQVLSEEWLAISWHVKYSYTFTWFGRPIIQYPEDIFRLQEIIYRIKPTVIIETGVAHGGSLVFYASLFKAMGFGRLIIGVDVEIRPHNRSAIEAHELASMITLVEGNSVAPEIVAQVGALLKPDDRVLVILDSNHSYAHVAAELEAYSRFVSLQSYIVATDGIMRLVADEPRAKREWRTDNPANAAEDFARDNPRYVIEEPAWRFNESPLDKSITAWPSAYLRRVA